MAFVDQLTIFASAGKGGDGVVRWLHLKSQEYSGPSGGNGGRGGDVYIKGVRDIALLQRYRGEKKFKAGDGNDGENKGMDGRKAEDMIIDLPVGSVVTNRATGEVFEILEENKPQLILKGGRGGAGNMVFKSSVNRSPMECTPGTAGESGELHIELRLIADAGLVGLPNAGKSSLLNTLTNAGAKIGAYAFTTLDPNLGALYGYVLADIPGLIEGASDGKGLGFQFLRHISRTHLLIHCVSVESADPLADYLQVRQEIEKYDNGVLKDKPEVVLLTKTDTRDSDALQQISDIFSKRGLSTWKVSILDDDSIAALKNNITQTLSQQASRA